MENSKNNLPFDTQELLDAMPDNERQAYTEVWELAALARPAFDTKGEKPASWNAVRNRIQSEDSDQITNTDSYLNSITDSAEKEALSEVWNIAGGIQKTSHEAPSKDRAWESIRTKISDISSAPAHTTHSNEANVTRLDTTPRKVSNTTTEAASSAKSSGNIYWLAAAVMMIGLAVWMWQITFSATVYTAPLGEIVSVQLDDRTTVQLNSGSELRVERGFGEKHRNVELAGEAFFDVEPGDTPFLVNTANAVVQVLGTSFNVRSWPGMGTSETTVALTQGSVEVYSNAEREFRQLMEPGEISRVRGVRTMPERVEALRIDEALAWRANNIAFNATRLIEAAAEIERRFNVSVEVANASAAQKTVTGFYLNPDSPEGILEDLASIAGLQLSFTNGKYTLK
ncbi:MAG: FecR domain-containing protein [Balneolia bacterium]|nr:FecR domain-containing protein [Balneolia bacterium]